MIATRPHAPLGALLELTAARHSPARLRVTRVGREMRQLVRIASPIAAIGAGVSGRVCTIVQRITLLVCLLAAAAATPVEFTPDLLRAAGLELEAFGTTRAYADYMACAFALLGLFALALLSATGRSRFAVVAVAAALPVNAMLNHVFMTGAPASRGPARPAPGSPRSFGRL